MLALLSKRGRDRLRHVRRGTPGPCDFSTGDTLASANFRPTFVERLGLQRLLSQPSRMILRHLERQPVKAMLSAFGIAMGIAVLIIGSFSADSIDYILDVQFQHAQRQDVSVSFLEPKPARTLHELQQLPGVIDCEPFRSLPARLRNGHLSRRTALLGLSPTPRLQRLINEEIQPVSLPAEGLVLADKLAELLDVRVGDLLTVEVLEGARPVRQVPVVLLVKEFLGAGAYMNIYALNRLVREGQSISGGYLTADGAQSENLYYALKHTPGVASVTLRKLAIRSFQDTIAENMSRMRSFIVMFATIIAFGVVYNSARIALAERGRELATLRVMGFTRGEISAILLGELAVLTLIAIPLGLTIGYVGAALMCKSMDTELYRIPMVAEPRTFGLAVLVVIVASVLSGLVVRRKLDHLDLIAVLKTRD
ncbi:MAG: FtsX-like permease family protein [Planctomycetota bacterium]